MARGPERFKKLRALLLRAKPAALWHAGGDRGLLGTLADRSRLVLNLSVRRLVAIAVVGVVVVVVCASLFLSVGGGEDPVFARWASANQKAIQLIARRAGTTVSRVDCGEYGGYPDEFGECNIVRVTGQCERWRYDVGSDRRIAQRLARSDVPDESPEPGSRYVICFYAQASNRP